LRCFQTHWLSRLLLYPIDAAPRLQTRTKIFGNVSLMHKPLCTRFMPIGGGGLVFYNDHTKTKPATCGPGDKTHRD
jgi:hypothetical protein